MADDYTPALRRPSGSLGAVDTPSTSTLPSGLSEDDVQRIADALRSIISPQPQGLDSLSRILQMAAPGGTATRQPGFDVFLDPAAMLRSQGVGMTPPSSGPYIQWMGGSPTPINTPMQIASLLSLGTNLLEGLRVARERREKEGGGDTNGSR